MASRGEPVVTDPLPRPAFDGHTHLDIMDRPVPGVLAAARDAGIARVITVGTDLESSRWSARCAAEYDDVYAAVAIHPNDTEKAAQGSTDRTAEVLAEIEALAGLPQVKAVGETGLDYYWDDAAPAVQQDWFRAHIAIAKRTGKVLMIHDRLAHADVLRILAEEGAPDRVVFHAFSGDEHMARACADQGFVLSIPGVISFTNAPVLRSATAAVPPDSLLVETDAPFLTPHPYRGRPNAPYLLPYTLLALARAIGVDPDELCASVMATGNRIFGTGLGGAW